MVYVCLFTNFYCQVKLLMRNVMSPELLSTNIDYFIDIF